MKRRWWIVGAGILLGVAVGFQQAEPLEALRRNGSLAQGVGGLKADEYLFIHDKKNVSGFLDSLAVVARCHSVQGLFVPKIDTAESRRLNMLHGCACAVSTPMTVISPS